MHGIEAKSVPQASLPTPLLYRISVKALTDARSSQLRQRKVSKLTLRRYFVLCAEGAARPTQACGGYKAGRYRAPHDRPCQI